jgi:hypothetical protein
VTAGAGAPWPELAQPGWPDTLDTPHLCDPPFPVG